MDSSAFLDRYPEFDLPDNLELVESVLAEVEGKLDASVFGDRFDEAHGALAAHTLWASPFGLSLRGDGDSPSRSKYLDHYENIKKAVTVPLSMMVIALAAWLGNVAPGLAAQELAHHGLRDAKAIGELLLREPGRA